MQAVYTFLYALGFVLLSPLFIYKMWKRGKYRENFFERFGRYSPQQHQRLATKTGPRCWIQAVSVGEVNLTLTFIAAFRQRFPQYQLVLSTTTSTGYALARERLPSDVALVYFPQDFSFAVRRAYELIAPDCIVLMESEVWPTHIWEAARRRLPVFLVNARMSPSSARGYRRMRWFFRTVFDKFTLVCAQSDDDAGNFRAGGVPAERVHMTGNIKFDASLPQAGARPFDPAEVLKQIGIAPTQPILVAGSTHPGEEEILFDLLHELRPRFPELFLVLVPRHVERTPEIVEVARQKKISFVLRKNGQPTGEKPVCLLVNTTGELKWFYDVATVVFVGKSLVGEGGQNIIEPAASGHPVVFGPNMQNFKAIAALFVAEGAGVQVADVTAFRQAVAELLTDSHRRDQIAAAARRVIAANVGATARTVELMAQTLSEKRV